MQAGNRSQTGVKKNPPRCAWRAQVVNPHPRFSAVTMSAPYYMYSKTRREFGRHCVLADAPAEVRPLLRARRRRFLTLPASHPIA